MDNEQELEGDFDNACPACGKHCDIGGDVYDGTEHDCGSCGVPLVAILFVDDSMSMLRQEHRSCDKRGREFAACFVCTKIVMCPEHVLSDDVVCMQCSGRRPCDLVRSKRDADADDAMYADDSATMFAFDAMGGIEG